MTDVVDVLRVCEVCGEWQHKSQFSAGKRGCRACQERERVWIDELAAAVKRQEAAKAQAVAIVARGTKPETLTGREWRIIQARARDESVIAIALTMGLAVPEVESMERSALKKVAKLAYAAADAQ